MISLYEKYRPAAWDQIIGQDKVLKQIKHLQTRGLAGRAYWISGASGTGKTSIAWLLAREIADDFYIMEIDSSDLTVSYLKQIIFDLRHGATGKGGRVVLINESHGLRKDVVRQLLVELERLPRKAAIIFTTTNEGQLLFEDKDDSSPLLSRCIALKLTNQGLAKPFAERALAIARAENLDGQPLSAYETLVKKCRNNFRAVLQEIESGTMIKDIG